MEEIFIKEIQYLKNNNEKVIKQIDDLNLQLEDCPHIQEKSINALKHELQGILRSQTKFIATLSKLNNIYQNEEFE